MFTIQHSSLHCCTNCYFKCKKQPLQLVRKRNNFRNSYINSEREFAFNYFQSFMHFNNFSYCKLFLAVSSLQNNYKKLAYFEIIGSADQLFHASKTWSNPLQSE